MITKKKIDYNTILLSTYSNHLIQIGRKYYKLIIGKTNKKFIFIRLVINNDIFENFFASKDEDYNDIYKQLLWNNNPSYSFNSGKNIIYLSYYQKNINLDIRFKLNLKSLAEKYIINSDNIKIEYNYNTKILSSEKLIVLSNISFNDEDFKNLCKISMKATLLNLERNNISDLSPLKSENIKFLQKLNLTLFFKLKN